MSIVMAPYGKGYGKYWGIAIAIFICLSVLVVLTGNLIDRINKGEIDNPLLVFLAHIFYPIYSLVINLLNFVFDWGVFAIAIISLVAFGLFWILNFAINFLKKKIKR